MKAATDISEGSPEECIYVGGSSQARDGENERVYSSSMNEGEATMQQRHSLKAKGYIHVIVGLIVQAHNVFVAQRPANKSHAGWWEFPGGKVEPNESPFAALCRELYEETSIEVQRATPWLHVPPDPILVNNGQSLPVLLDVWWVDAFTGTLVGAEGQHVQWMPIEELAHIKLLPANRPIVEKLLAAR